MSTPYNKTKGLQGLDSLGNHIYLEKQDRLRDIGIDIQTSQIVVVGGQSSGKSSLLELLTGFAFPRGQGLCTRYATQITLRRASVVNIVASITPRNDCGEELKAELRAFRRELEEFDPKELGRIIEDAAVVMGIRAGDNKDDTSLPMFSDDILKVEISGPDQPHLTVIDVPGLSQVTGDAGITELDKTMVERMVKRYMQNERTIVLAVVPCLSDPATERILQLAKEADPAGVRTIGVLTKADLVYEKAVLSNLLKQVQSGTLKLGYFIVRNRGADEDDLSVDQCKLKERELFLKPQWSEITRIRRTGVEALRSELQTLLMDLAKRELPKQKAEVMNRLSDCLEKQKEMGIARPDAVTQREYLTKHASKFERIARDALEGRYGVNPIFAEKPELRLITKIISLNEGFSDLMWRKGHLRNFVGSTTKEKTKRYDADDSEPFEYEDLANEAHSVAPSFPELRNVFPNDNSECEPPSDDPIMEHIGQCYRESRGPELGTFGGSMLPITFREQARKWAPIANAHVRTVIITVHCFIKQLLSTVFVDERMRDELWDSVLLDTLVNAYIRALRKADYLIGIELRSCPSTYNHYFADNLQKSRTERLEAQVAVLEKESQNRVGGGDSAAVNTRAELKKMVREKSNAEQVKEDIHDTLKSYYKVARKRFVDVMCQQAIDDHLLNGENSPLRILTSDMVAKMSDSQLDRIAGEDAATKRERKMLEDEIAGLKTALDVLRG